MHIDNYCRGSKKNNDVYWTLCICIFCSIVYANSVSNMVVTCVGLFSTLLVCLKIIIYDYSNGYMLLLGTQFLRATMRINVGGRSFSFLLLAMPLFIIKNLIENRYKVSPKILVAYVLLIWDLFVSFAYGTLAVGDQVLWGLSFAMLLEMCFKNLEVEPNRLVAVFSLAIWGICLVNVFAEIRLYGQTLNPSMYGTWNSLGEYYSFGKGYLDIAGGNEIAQYIPLYLCMTLFNYKEFGRIEKIYHLTSMAFFTYCGFMCIARAFYVELIVLMLFCFIILSKKPTKMMCVLVIVAVFTTVLIINFAIKLQPVFDAVLTRFNSGSSSRQYLILETIELWKSSVASFLFGIGTEYNSVYDTAHNIVVDSFISFGLVGTTIYFITILHCVVHSVLVKHSKGLINYVPLIMLAIYKMVSGCIKDVPFYFVIAICLLYIKNGNYNIKNDSLKKGD